MGWKNIKNHYQIKHIVQVRGGRIGIGSSMIHDLIRISFDGVVSWGNLGPATQNDDLMRIFKAMESNPAELKKLLDAPDSFVRSLPVWTYDGAEIIEKSCEEYGWPNCTHDGLLMYENAFFSNRLEVVEFAMRNAWARVKHGLCRLEEIKDQLKKTTEMLQEDVAALAKLELDYPDVHIHKNES